LGFHPGENPSFQNNAFSKGIGTTNEDQTLGFHPRNRDSMLEKHHQKCSPPMPPPPFAEVAAATHQTPDTHEESMPHSLHRNQYTFPPLQTSDRSHHDILHICQIHGNLYLDISHGTDKKAKLRATPS
jgi:hypothetical protein